MNVRACVPFFRIGFLRLAICIVSAMCSTAQISNRISRCAMPFDMCSLATNRSASLLSPSFVRSFVWSCDIEPDSGTVSMKEPPALPPVLAEKIARTETASENLKMPIPIDLMASRESLYAAVRYSSRNLFDIESRGTPRLTISYPSYGLDTLHPSQHIS